MKPSHLNLEFAPQSHRLPVSRLLYLLLAVVVFGLAAFQAAQAHYEKAREQQQLADLHGQRLAPASKSGVRAKSDPAEIAQAQLVRQTSQRLSTPWADLLAALEEAPTNVALLLVEPSATKRSVSLTAEAAGPVDMLKYLKALQSDARFSEVILVSHQVQVQAPGSPVRFQLRARWGEAP